MNKLSNEVQERIKSDAERYAGLMAWVNQDPEGNQPLFHEYISSTSYIAGATAVHERAQKLIKGLLEGLEQIVHAPVPVNEREYMSWFVTAKNVAGGAIAAYEAEIETEQWKQGKEGEKPGESATYNLTTDEKKKLLCGKIEGRMKEAGLNRQKFADLMGAQPSTITRWLSGEHNFEINTLFEIEKQLNISLFNL